MKRRLFWKILFGFWLAFFLTSQSLWIWFTAHTNSQTFASEPEVLEQAAPAVLAAAQSALIRDGPRGVTSLMAALPPAQREALSVAPDGRAGPATASRPAMTIMERQARAPDGRDFRIRYAYSRRPALIEWTDTTAELPVFGLIGGLLFSALLAAYLAWPIERLRRGFHRLAMGQLDVRLAHRMGRRRDEITDLAHDFDRMAQRLEQLVAARDQLLHHVSHELRSPLARLRLAIGLARQSPARLEQSLDRIDYEANRLDLLIGELLTLARTEHHGFANIGYFDLPDIVETVVDDVRFEADAAGVGVRLILQVPDEEARVSLAGDAELMRRAIENVLRNALRFSPRGGEIAVHVGWGASAARYRIDVEDGGPGVSPERIDALFEPFVRGADPGPGFGLGLAIARRAVAIHGGSIEARNRDGGGLRVSIELPVAPLESR